MKKHLKWLHLLVILLLLAGCSTPQETVTLLPPPTQAPEQPSAQATEPPAATLPAATQPPSATDTPAPTETPLPSPTPGGPQAVVQEVVNEVDAHTSADQEWQPAALNMIVYQGGEVWAKAASTALLGLSGENIRVAPDTIFSMVQPDENTLQIDLQEGQIWLNIEGLEAGENFEVTTPAAVAAVSGTRFSVRVEADGKSIFSSWEGSVVVTATSTASPLFISWGSQMPVDTVIVEAGQQTDVLPGQAPAPPYPMTDDELLRWGMAQGPGLTPLLPLVGVPGKVALPGESSGHSFAGSSSQMATTYYDFTTSQVSFFVYNTNTGEGIFPALGEDAVDPVYNPLNDSLFYISASAGSSALCSANLDGSDPTCFSQSSDYIYTFAPSPDWQWVALTRDSATGRDLFLIRPDGTDETLLVAGENAEINFPTWSPDGTKVAYDVDHGFSQPAELWWTAVDGSDSLMIFDNLDPRAYGAIAWSPDGGWLAVPGYTGGLWLVSADGSQEAVQVDDRDGSYYAVSWTPRGGGWPLFYYLIDEGLYYVAAPGLEPVYFGSPDLSGPFWNGDGTWAAFYTNILVDGAYQSNIYFFQAMLDFLPAQP